MVRYARAQGIKPAARYFHTTVRTVRKWLRRWQPGSLAGLHDRSRAPLPPAQQITPQQRAPAQAPRRSPPLFRIRRLLVARNETTSRIDSAGSLGCASAWIELHLPAGSGSRCPGITQR
jgi:hypothetical protein